MSEPIIVLHRRNRSDLLAGLPPNCWIEVDVDLHDGVPVLSHDPIVGQGPEILDTFLLRAVLRGISGFIFDCKREGVEKAVKPLLASHNIANYFYLNEMEVQADIFLEGDRNHHSAMRIWQYRNAHDLIRYAADKKEAKQNHPSWAWVDCWQRDLPHDMSKAFNPINKADAAALKQSGVRLCICSPELYAHDYSKTYQVEQLQGIYRGILRYRECLARAGIEADAVCTKFPWLWSRDINLLTSAKQLEP